MATTVRGEKHALPGTVDGICSLIREILSTGHVKRIELDQDDNFVRSYRWVEKMDLEEDAVSWDGALRNVPLLQEYYSEGATSYQILVDMTLLAQEDGMRCSCWVTGVGSEDLLRKWLEVDRRKLPVSEIHDLLGLPVYRVKSLPEETLILCCSKYSNIDPTEVSMAIKTAIDLRRDNDSSVQSDFGGGGDHPQERPAATRQLALTTGGLRKVPWRAPRPTRHKQPKGGGEVRSGPEGGDHEGHGRNSGNGA